MAASSRGWMRGGIISSHGGGGDRAAEGKKRRDRAGGRGGARDRARRRREPRDTREDQAAPDAPRSASGSLYSARLSATGAGRQAQLLPLSRRRGSGPPLRPVRQFLGRQLRHAGPQPHHVGGDRRRERRGAEPLL